MKKDTLSASASDRRATQRDVLLRSLARMLVEMRCQGVDCPAVLDGLVLGKASPTSLSGLT